MQFSLPMIRAIGIVVRKKTPLMRSSVFTMGLSSLAIVRGVHWHQQGQQEKDKHLSALLEAMSANGKNTLPYHARRMVSFAIYVFLSPLKRLVLLFQLNYKQMWRCCIIIPLFSSVKMAHATTGCGFEAKRGRGVVVSFRIGYLPHSDISKPRNVAGLTTPCS